MLKSTGGFASSPKKQITGNSQPSPDKIIYFLAKPDHCIFGNITEISFRKRRCLCPNQTVLYRYLILI